MNQFFQDDLDIFDLSIKKFGLLESKFKNFGDPSVSDTREYWRFTIIYCRNFLLHTIIPRGDRFLFTIFWTVTKITNG